MTTKKTFTAKEIMDRLLKINPQIDPKSKFTNPFIARDVERWYKELAREELKDYLMSQWKNSSFISKSCNCGKRKDVCYKRAFLEGYKGSQYAKVYPGFFEKLKEEYNLSKIQIEEIIIEIVKEDLVITSVYVQPPGDCGCSNVPPIIISV